MDFSNGILAKLLAVVKFNEEMKKMREDVMQMNGLTQKLNTSMENMLKAQAEMYQLFEIMPLFLGSQQKLLETHVTATARAIEIEELPRVDTTVDLSSLFGMGIDINQPGCSQAVTPTPTDDTQDVKRRIRSTTPEEIRQKARDSELRWNEKRLEKVDSETEMKRLKRTLYNRERISKETPEERALRLEKKRYARKLSLMTETEEERQLRLHKKRVAKRRKAQGASSQSGSVVDSEQRINLEMLCNGSL